jgi:hypothetical protein
MSNHDSMWHPGQHPTTTLELITVLWRRRNVDAL